MLHFTQKILSVIKTQNEKKSMDERRKIIWRDLIEPLCTTLWAAWSLLFTNNSSLIFFNFITSRCK